MKTIISFDIDGVLARFEQGFVPIINELFGKNLPVNFSPNDWEYSEVLTPAEMSLAFNRIKKQKNFWRDLKGYTENIESLSRFLLDEHKYFDVYYVTSRMDTEGDSAFGQTAHWLINNHLLLYNTSLLVVRDPKEKNHILRGLNVKVSIDDYLPTVIQSNEIPHHQAYLLDRSWNRANRPNNIKVVQNVRHYIEEIRNARAVGV